MKRAYLFLGVFLALWGVVLLQVLSGQGEVDSHVSTYLHVISSPTATPAFAPSSQPAASSVSVPRAAGSSLLRHSGASSSASPEFGTLYQGTSPSSGYRIYASSSRSVQSVGGGGGGAVTGGTGATSRSSAGGLGGSFSSVSAPIAMAAAASSYRSPVSLAARSVEGGETADQTYARISPRRAIIHDGDEEDGYGDENLHPTNPPADPYFTPVGETPWWFILALGALYLLTTVLRKKTQAFSY